MRGITSVPQVGAVILPIWAGPSSSSAQPICLKGQMGRRFSWATPQSFLSSEQSSRSVTHCQSNRCRNARGRQQILAGISADIHPFAYRAAKLRDGVVQPPPLLHGAQFQNVAGRRRPQCGRCRIGCLCTHACPLASVCSHTRSSFNTWMVRCGIMPFSFSSRQANAPAMLPASAYTTPTMMKPKKYANRLG